MKRLGSIICLSLMIVLFTSSFCFADGLKLEDTYPRDGDKNRAIDNFGVKLYFNQDVNNEAFAAQNEKYLVITDEDGKKVPTLVVYSPKEKGLVMVLADTSKSTTKNPTIDQATTYTLKVSENFTAADGSTLGEDKTISFTTLDRDQAMKMNMLLMAVMFVCIFVVSMREQKKKIQEAMKQQEKEYKVNPYKVSKETGKSVKEIVQEEKEKQQKLAEERREKQAKTYTYKTEAVQKEANPFAFKVKSKKTVAEGGSTFITGRKAIAEAKAAEARAKGTTKPKKQSVKKKGKKKK